MEKVRRQAKQYLSRQKKQQRWQKVVTTLAGMVVFCTTYALILPAITMTTPLVCETPEHIHTEECYTVETVTYERELVCGLTEQEPHVHDESCYTEETTYGCGLAETEPHTHGEGCYTLTRGELTCTLEEETVERQVERQVEKQVEQETTNEEGETVIVLETVYETVTETVLETVPHVHTDACYAWSEELTCGLEETEGHIHSEDCGIETVKVLTCGKEESEGHTHSDECWFIPENEGETEEILVLSCGQEEHIHDDNCYLALELEEKVKYYCGFDTEHIHTEECYFEDSTLKCTIPEHTHSEVCLEEPLPAPVPVELSESFTAESEDGAVVLTLHVDGTVLLPRAELDGEPLESSFRLLVTQSEDMETYDEYAEMAAEEGEVMMVGVLDYTLTYDGEAVDLDACEVTVEVTPTEAFQEMLDAPEALGLMTLDLTDGLDGQEAEPEMELFFKAYTDRQGTVAYSVTKGANPRFTVEYYANLKRIKTENGTGTALQVIDTSGGNLPANGTVKQARNIYVKDDGQIDTEEVLTEIYAKQEFEYSAAPGLLYVNIVANATENFDLRQIWVLSPDKDMETAQDSDWTVYPYDQSVRITNRLETAEGNSDYILIEDGAVLRLIYDPAESGEDVPVNVYDYDITSGTGAGTKADPVRTNQQGINQSANYEGAGAKFAFGNANTGMGLQDEVWTDLSGNSNKLNQANREYNKNTDTEFKGSFSTFGLVKEIIFDEAGSVPKLLFSQGISAPNLFGGEAKGKTEVTGLDTLEFKRVGDTFTFSGIKGSGGAVSGMDVLKHPTESSSNWTNNFFPLDDLTKADGIGNDKKFGNKDEAAKVYYGSGSWDYLPLSDDNQLHNSYFGMTFAVEFSLTKDYVGPLEYYFFGDDDMWVFLVNKETGEQKLVCDIGGVHTSVGEYVDLWDYIDKDALQALGKDENDNDKKMSYELYFFYTERGASGSTCWMQFTLPTVVGLDLEDRLKDLVDEEHGALWIEKQLSGIESNQTFDFTLTLSGDEVYDNYTASFISRDASGQTTSEERVISANEVLHLQENETLVIYNLPKNTEYTITEVAESKPGYHTTVTTSKILSSNGVGEEILLGTENTDVASGMIEAKTTVKVVYTNTATYELPATGGAGTTLWYTMGALALLGAAYLMYKKRQWNLREGDRM